MKDSRFILYSLLLICTAVIIGNIKCCDDSQEYYRQIKIQEQNDTVTYSGFNANGDSDLGV